MDYLVELVGHVIERQRPEGFPKEVISSSLYRAESDQVLANYVNSLVEKIVANGGFIVLKPGVVLEESRMTFDQRIFVPIHMISYYEARVHPLSQEMVDAADPNVILQ